MSVILTAGRKRPDISKRDMSKKRKLIRKAGNMGAAGVAKVTTGWELDLDGTKVKISFSRDNFHVWVNSAPVQTTAYISDEGYDVDLFFSFDSHKGHIFSDVDNDRDEMINYILIDDVCMGDSYQTVHHPETS